MIRMSDRVFTIFLVIMVLAVCFGGVGFLYNIASEGIYDLEPLIQAWSSAYGEGFRPWNIISLALLSLPPVFIVPTTKLVFQWSVTGHLDGDKLTNLQDRIIYTYYVLVNQEHDPNEEQFNDVNWFPDTDPITGEPTNETDENGNPIDTWGDMDSPGYVPGHRGGR